MIAAKGLKLAKLLREDADDCARPDRAQLLLAAADEIEALTEWGKLLSRDKAMLLQARKTNQ